MDPSKPIVGSRDARKIKIDKGLKNKKMSHSKVSYWRRASNVS
jgi:hypothetical protein